MRDLCRVSLLLLAAGVLAASASAQITPIGPFTGDAQEPFECRVVFKPCMDPDCTTMFGSATNTLCTPGASGCHTTGGWSFRCVIRPHGGNMFFGSAGGWVRYTFDPPVRQFGGYFGSNAPRQGENNDPTLTFRDESGNELGKAIQKVGDGDCKWYWGGWKSTGAPIAEVDVVGKLFGGAFIDMDDMEISFGAECEPCDTNCDGSVDLTDVEPFIELLIGEGKPCDTCSGDTNDDGSVDLTDVEGFLECLLG